LVSVARGTRVPVALLGEKCHWTRGKAEKPIKRVKRREEDDDK